MYYMYFMYYSWCLFKHRRRNRLYKIIHNHKPKDHSFIFYSFAYQEFLYKSSPPPPQLSICFRRPLNIYHTCILTEIPNNYHIYEHLPSFNQGQPHILLQQKRLHNSERTQTLVLTKLKTKSLLAASLSLNPSIFLSQANDVSRQIVPLCCVSIINERAQQHRYYRAKNKRQQINTKVFRFFLLLFFNRLKYLGPMSIMNTA